MGGKACTRKIFRDYTITTNEPAYSATGFEENHTNLGPTISITYHYVLGPAVAESVFILRWRTTP